MRKINAKHIAMMTMYVNYVNKIQINVNNVMRVINQIKKQKSVKNAKQKIANIVKRISINVIYANHLMALMNRKNVYYNVRQVIVNNVQIMIKHVKNAGKDICYKIIIAFHVMINIVLNVTMINMNVKNAKIIIYIMMINNNVNMKMITHKE